MGEDFGWWFMGYYQQHQDKEREILTAAHSRIMWRPVFSVYICLSLALSVSPSLSLYIYIHSNCSSELGFLFNLGECQCTAFETS